MCVAWVSKHDLRDITTNWAIRTHQTSQEHHHIILWLWLRIQTLIYPVALCLWINHSWYTAITHNILDVWHRFYIKNTVYCGVLSAVWCAFCFRTRYWSPLDEMLREAAVLRKVKVRLLISLWAQTHPLTFNFMTSMQALCTGLPGCSVEVVRKESDGLIPWYT